jgi:hypothetical protein
MQREGDRLKPLAIRALYAFPPRDFRVGGRDLTRGLVVGCALRMASLVPREAASAVSRAWRARLPCRPIASEELCTMSCMR